MLSEEEIRKAARESAAEITKRSVKDSDALVSSGLVDSLAILKLIARLEEKLRVNLPTDQLQPDDFDSVELIVETIQRVTA
jgi:acyl carrier protein